MQFIHENVKVDSLAAYISHVDRQVRQKAVVGLGNTGDRRAIEPLLFALSREVFRGANSYPVIIDILDAMEKIPDRQALDALLKLEWQLVDRNSSVCPTELPAGVITYVDTRDGRLQRAVPKELHFKLFDVMRRISARLDYRKEEVSARYLAYQDEVIRAEIERTIPRLARVFREESSFAGTTDPGVANASEAHNDLPAETPSSSPDATADVDYDVLRRELEIEVSGYVRDNERLQRLIRKGQRVKAHIQHAKLEKREYDAVLHPGPAGVRELSGQ